MDLAVGYLFYDTFKITDYVASNGGTNNEMEKIWKEVDMA
jgi:hypothetical protein